jgi:hypothetical protein
MSVLKRLCGEAQNGRVSAEEYKCRIVIFIQERNVLQSPSRFVIASLEKEEVHAQGYLCGFVPNYR